ncbi:MAG: hypothetical protein K6V97_03835 [Actinomycetia bacterium]|nr:hypothetical protein [Actinomycetes bacterium]
MPKPMQGALAAARQPNPYRWRPGPQPQLARVIARHPDDNTVDVVYVTGVMGGHIDRHVPWCAGTGLGTQTGGQYLPKTTTANALSTAAGPYAPPIPGTEDVYVYVDWAHGSGRQPMVIGIAPAPNSAIAPQQEGWAVWRHESGVWFALDPDGNLTLAWPDGTTLAIGPSGQSATPTDINPNWPPASGPPVTVVLKTSGGATLELSGPTITLNGGTAGVARVGDPVQVTVNGTVYTGQITGGSSTVKSG